MKNYIHNKSILKSSPDGENFLSFPERNTKIPLRVYFYVPFFIPLFENIAVFDPFFISLAW